MQKLRKPLQGVTNIIRFNWHFYVLAMGIAIALLIFGNLLFDLYLVQVSAFAILGSTIVSLVVSAYIYDFSHLYSFDWLNELNIKGSEIVINLTAGFDETSHLLKAKYKISNLAAFDFYNPEKHTEISIKRARKEYPSFSGTVKIDTSELPIPTASVDKAFCIFAAHEIRNDSERIQFFRELSHVLNPSGLIVVTEHLRDLPNFLAYNVGSFHFLPKCIWINTFMEAGLTIQKEFKVTPFITTFILKRHGESN